jgi:hypothetical protein
MLSDDTFENGLIGDIALARDDTPDDVLSVQPRCGNSVADETDHGCTP